MGERYEKEVTLSDAGAYKCLAINDDGEAASGELSLAVEGTSTFLHFIKLISVCQ
jgi:hypothetical protein